MLLHRLLPSPILSRSICSARIASGRLGLGYCQFLLPLHSEWRLQTDYLKFSGCMYSDAEDVTPDFPPLHFWSVAVGNRKSARAYANSTDVPYLIRDACGEQRRIPEAVLRNTKKQTWIVIFRKIILYLNRTNIEFLKHHTRKVYVPKLYLLDCGS